MQNINIKTIGSDVLVTIAYDSIKAKKLTFEQSNIVEAVAVSIMKEIIVGNYIRVKVSQMTENPMIIKILALMLGGTLMTILYRAVMGYTYSVKDIVMKELLKGVGKTILDELMQNISIPIN